MKRRLVEVPRMKPWEGHESGIPLAEVPRSERGPREVPKPPMLPLAPVLTRVTRWIGKLFS